MDYNFDNNGQVDILTVQGNVLTGVYNAEIIEKVGLLIREGSNKMIVRLGEVKFINSNGLNLLLNILTKYRKASGEIVLANVPEELDKLLVMTKLNSIFISRNTIEEATAYLNSH
jgi:anti-sigma B factor antagonist